MINSITKQLIRLALEEDTSGGDLTSELTVSADQCGVGYLKCKESSVICGLEIVPEIIKEAGASLHAKFTVKDGDKLVPGQVFGEISGNVRDLLRLERTILNFIQRLSGCATLARNVTEEAGALTICDTRKTTPGFRSLEKYAVRVGGASNHRFDLGQMVLVKDNHIDANGGDIAKTLQKVFSAKPPYSPVEIEVRNLDEVKTALEFPVTAIMLDNMGDNDVQSAVKIIKKNRPECIVEVSGGMTPERIKKLSGLGANTVSMGMLTNKYISVDLSLDIKLSVHD
jgi:nicotinate-nucleotide pyrophosphorylase (carboxylating)